jgi:hypothetical protein
MGLLDVATSPLQGYIMGGMAITIIALGFAVSYEKAQYEAADAKLTLSQSVLKTANDSIIRQNTQLEAAEKSHNQVQKQLDVANGLNIALKGEFSKIRGDLNNRPIPKDCPTAIQELQEQSKILVKKWKK